MKTNTIIIITIVVLVAIAGFFIFSNKDNTTKNKSSKSQNNTDFTLPEKVTNFTGDGGDSQINFQTDMTIDEILEFYRTNYENDKYNERKLLTVKTDDTLNLVFDGHESGKSIVIQATKLPNATNINIRLESIGGEPETNNNKDKMDPMENDSMTKESLKSDLEDVTGGTSSGIGYIVRDDKLRHQVTASLPTPAEGSSYEGWLVNQSTNDFFSTGLMDFENGEYKLQFLDDETYPGYNFIVITEETVVDENPETHILEGLAQ